MSKRTVVKIAGESGMGIESSGMIVMKALKHLGFNIYAEREFPSLIKGGRANIQINFSSEKVRSLSSIIDIAVAIDREGVLDSLETLKEGGILIHGFERWNKAIKNLPQLVEEKKLQVHLIPAREIADESGGGIIMVNVVLLGYLWKILGFDLESLKLQIANQFSKKPQLLEVNYRCAEGGYNYSNPQNSSNFDPFERGNEDLITNNETTPTTESSPLDRGMLSTNFQDNGNKQMLIDGNSSLVLGAIHAGVRAYCAYPMSPSSSILSYFAQVADKLGIAVKQAEDEITVAQLTLGSMHMGTRALCATSGGGYDLMTETVSLSGMIETPFVCIVVQRPGPATGLPTWTGQADLNMAIYSSHGEFPRIVLACSDPKNCFENIQTAFNLAEKYQVPVIVLSEANIAMSYSTEEKFEEGNIGIERGIAGNGSNPQNSSNFDPFERGNEQLKMNNETKLTTSLSSLDSITPKPSVHHENRGIGEVLVSSDRYKITESGVSKRWLPGSSETIYYANGDEHWEDGSLTEDGEKVEQMISKRLRKMNLIEEEILEPELFGAEKAKVSFVGWGSTKNTILDAMDVLKNEDIEINYLHYNFLWPLKTDKLIEFFHNNPNIYLIEGNHEGQFGQLIKQKTGLDFKDKFLKWNGRPFYVEEVVEFAKSKIN